MRFFRLLTLVCLCPLIMRNTAAESYREADVVIIVDSPEVFAGADAAEASPWMSFPCQNPEHFYIKPEGAAEADVRFPESCSEVDGGERLSFSRRFIDESAAVGFRPWECHYEERDGELIHIERGEGCHSRTETVRALTLAVIDAVLEANAGNRVALTAFAGENDSRYSLNFTRDREKLFDMLYALPECLSIDRSTALKKAGSYLSRRSQSEKRTRDAYVIMITGAPSDSLEYETRAYENALLLRKSASLGAICVSTEDCGFIGALGKHGVTVVSAGLVDGEEARSVAEELTRSLGLGGRSQERRPPIFRLLKAAGIRDRAR